MINPVIAMQQAVDVVLSSPHPDSKVAATLFSGDEALSRTNEWPQKIRDRIGTETRIGDSSGTVHAEVNCILNAPFPTEGASLAITDPCCPNCAKSIAEAGIKTVYIDHKGFEKGFAARLGSEFENMSLRILAHAGISLFIVHRKDNKVTELYRPAPDYVPPEENPIEIKSVPGEASDALLRETVRGVRVKHDRWGCALATDKDGHLKTLVASAHPAVGYTHEGLEQGDGKYDFMLEPVNRILTGAARNGLKVSRRHFYCSTLPTPRETVNLIAAGVEVLTVADTPDAVKKPVAEDAKRLLESTGIVTFITV